MQTKNIDVNYKNKKRYKTAKLPIRQPMFFTWLIWMLSFFALLGKKKRIEKIDMEGLKPPYMILSNHMCFLDFELAALATYPHRINNVVNIDGYLHRAWLMEWIGCIATRKFTSDFHLVKSIRTSLARGDVLCMYPEARYSPCGITSYIPDSVGALVKRNGAPVVAIVHHGNYLHAPFWNFRKKRKVPFYTTVKKILTPEQIKDMSIEEINTVLQRELTYDEYAYQKESGILIKEKFRAEGLHKILYRCPHCNTEFKMGSEGADIFCTECGKRWNMKEDGSLQAYEGATEFSHIPDWFNWEREQVEAEIERGEYSYSDEVDVFSQPRCNGFVKLGKGKIRHNAEEGFVLEGEHNGEAYRIQRAPLQINSLHVEYDYFRIRRADCFDISTENDSFYCYPAKENIVTKLAFATEIIYLKKAEEKRHVCASRCESVCPCDSK
ncbi:MAG: 1-acyl-sn-glycerol-3-phosphate acyltransferase [Clostridia bacterium]|nr:1-acyl-sn-glycerol-3-phosphate acyltransferase [Clostridia bacterium]